jgi:uncharacterized iron-regulated membrane protein
MGTLWPRVNRWLTWFHRWSGVVLCLLFIAWFASGAVLLYVPYPALSEHDRLAHSEAIDASRVTRSAAVALAQVQGAEELTLISVAGHPIYLVYASDGKPAAIPGDDVPAPGLFSAATALTVAERFGNSSVNRVDGPLQYDQWIVHQRFDPFRPFYRVRLNDVARTDLYVSARTGQVLQRTRGTERAWNWCGAVLHWIYFTPLRKSWSAWNQTVWWLSLIALLASVAGTWLGIQRMLKTRAASRSAWSPFRGWMKWHHVMGLFASVIVLFWMLSGWLSMDHGRLFSKGVVSREASLRFRGRPLDTIARAVPPELLPHVGPASEVRFGAVAGRAFVAARGGNLSAPKVFWLDTPEAEPTAAIHASLLVAGLEMGWPHQSITQDAPTSSRDFYAVAESLGDTALPFDVGESRPLRIYADGVTGQLLVVMDTSRRAYAWVYYALHTLNFPGLLEHDTARAILALVLLLIGLTFSATGAVLGYRRLRRSFST